MVQPAIVARVSTAMMASESFFITESTVPWMYALLLRGSCGALVQKRHCGRHSIDGRRFALEESREIPACASLSAIPHTRSVFGGLVASAFSGRTAEAQ